MSDDAKEKFVEWYERLIPALVSLLLAAGVWQINELRKDVASVREQITEGQLQQNGLVLQVGWISDRANEIRQTQIKLEERIRALEQTL